MIHRPLAGARFGVEVDLDPTVALAPDEQEELRRLFWQHGIVVMRDRPMSHEDQRRLVGYLGPILEDGKHYVSNVLPDALLGSYELKWHSDVSYTEAPYLGVALRAVDVVDGETATRYASTGDGYRNLPPALRERVQDLDAVFSFRSDATLDRETGLVVGAPSRRRPVVDHHRETGEPVLAVNLQQTVALLDLPEDEARDLLEEIYAVLYAPDNVYEHWWRMHDLVVWDNQKMQHARADLTGSGPRTLRRVTLGTASVEEQIPGFGDAYQGYYGKPHPVSGS